MICETPAATAVANPLVASCVLSIVATPICEDNQVASRVTFCPGVEVPSGFRIVAVAVNCCVPGRAAIVANFGVTARSEAPVTKSIAGNDVTDPKVAVMLDVPAPLAVARPPEVIVPTLVLVEAHVRLELVVRFCVVPSLYLPVAVNC